MSKELPLGRYYLIETGAPVGYILEDVPYEADLTYLDGNTPVVTIQVRADNKYLPASVTLVKHKEVTEVVTSENGMVHQVITTAPGEGFTFGLYRDAACTELIETVTNHANGTFTFSPITYTVADLGENNTAKTYGGNMTVGNGYNTIKGGQILFGKAGTYGGNVATTAGNNTKANPQPQFVFLCCFLFHRNPLSSTSWVIEITVKSLFNNFI